MDSRLLLLLHVLLLSTCSLMIRAEDEVPQAPSVSCHEFLNPVTYVPTIVVNWTMPSANSTFENYRISYLYDVLWSGEHDNDSAVVNGSKSFYTITFPSSYSNYTIAVEAVAADGMLGDPGFCYLLTSEAPPGAPQNLTLLNASSDSLMIQWEPPVVENGIIRGYTVHWKKNGHIFGDGSGVEAEEGKESYTYTMRYLAPSSYYHVKVRAHTIFAGLAADKTFSTSPSESSPEEPDNGLLIFFCSLFGILSVVFLVIIIYLKRGYIGSKCGSLRRNSRSSSTQSE